MVYSQLKPLHYVEKIAALACKEVPAPVHVQLILSDLCNQDCGFCAYRMSAGLSKELFATPETHNPNRKIDTDKALEIIDDCAELGVRAIQFTGGGEPTLHKDFYDIVAHAQGYGMSTALVTNGVRLEPRTEIMRMKWIRVSVDAGDAKTYVGIRRVSSLHWDKVWSNIRSLGDYDGVLGVGFVVTPNNWTEISACADLARANGADNLRVGAVFSNAGVWYYDGLFDKIADEVAAVKEKHDSEDFTVFDLFGRRMSDLESGRPTQPFCGYQYFTTYIGADLNVYRCCNTAYTKKGRLGSIKDKRLIDAYPEFNFSPFDARSCEFCQFRGQNEAINSFLETPEHVEFV